MAHALKIKKAQAIITITDTVASTGVITCVENLNTLGVIKGMPIVFNSTIDTLIGGTTYYVFQVLTANTFTVSANDPSNNPSIFTVGDETGLTTLATVAPVGGQSENPTSNPYGVVGGNIYIQGSQLLASAYFLQEGDVPLYARTTSPYVYSLDGNINAGDVFGSGYLYDENMTLIGSADSSGGPHPTIIETQETGDLVIANTSGMESLDVGGIITFEANIGGIVANTAYFVLAGASGNAFQISNTAGGSPLALTDDTGSVNAVQSRVTLDANATANLSGTNYFFTNQEDASILRQKGKSKYLVQGIDSGITRVCYTSNTPEPNTIVVWAEDDDSSYDKLMSFSGHNAIAFNNDTGNIATGNLDIGVATRLYTTFEVAEAANASAGVPYPVVRVEND